MLAALVVTQTVGGDGELVFDERLAGRRAPGAVAIWLRAPLDRRDGRARRGAHGSPRRSDLHLAPATTIARPCGSRRWSSGSGRARDAQIEVLGGGITNRNFKITLDDGAYVLRIGGKDTELLGIDRRVEHEASLAAAAVGVGPEVVAFIEPEGYLVTRFIGGTVVGPEAIREPEALRRVAQSLRAVHGGPADPGAVRLVPRRRGLRRDGGDARRRPIPPAYDRARATAARVERARGPGSRAAVPQRPAHRQLHRRRHADPDRGLGVRGHGRRLLRPGELRRQQRAVEATRPPSCCARTSATCARSTSAR